MVSRDVQPTGRSGLHRLTITTHDTDPRAAAIAAAARQLGIADLDDVTVSDIVFVHGDLDDGGRTLLTGVLVDPLLQHGTWDDPDHTTPTPSADGTTAGSATVEIVLHAGVTDSGATAVEHAADTLGLRGLQVATGRRVSFGGALDPAIMDAVVTKVVANPVIEHWASPTVTPQFDFGSASPTVDTVAIRTADDEALAAINAERGLSLDPTELRRIRAHFDELGRDPTDAELETLAQTWSEHCAHKTFRARITAHQASDTRHGTGDSSEIEVEPLLRQLRGCTEEIDADFVRSAFVGNAGVVEFTPGISIALKAETHNHPSAIEPFGGANTGVGGVIRDVLGIAHRPIAVTDVLCFGPAHTALDELPAGALHPQRIADGVIDGVADYGNKIGLPTVAGAVLYDRGYTTNPLVFAGCIGIAPSRPLHDGPFPGDRVVVLGGATGRDGIRGATFSSATMDATTGEVAGASVQIGDPIIEKLLIDALIGAEDLYSAITDCGAGGLSSAVGEMAERVGADVDLDLVDRKYPGLAPWEVWLSEAQERMVVAVPPAHLAELTERCARAGVAVADIGEFTGSGRLVVRAGEQLVVDLDTEFLHDGRPQRLMTAELPVPNRSTPSTRTAIDPAATLLALLAHPNIGSKAATIHRYDHEILGATAVRPLIGIRRDGHGDGVVLAEPTATDGIAVGIGVNPWFGLHDPEAMAFAVVDEAIRNVVAVGADPDRIALLDNFSWGDPRRPSTLGELVAAVAGCCDAALLYGTPFVSGKDSLNNEYVGSDGERHAVPPTLVITAVAAVPDVDACVTADLARPGDLVVLIGQTAPEFAGSHYDLVHERDAHRSMPGPDAGVVPAPDPGAPERYRTLHRAIRDGLVVACHDVSEGGLAVALAEMCIAGRLGAHITDLPDTDTTTALFAESNGRFVLEVTRRNADRVVELFGDDATVLGSVTDDGRLLIDDVFSVGVDRLVAAFETPPSSTAPDEGASA